MSNGTPPIQPAPVPPSIAGIPQPVFGSGSATVPATNVPITGSPIIPPPPIANPVGVPVFPPTGGNTAPVPIPPTPLVGPAVGPAPVPPSIPGVPQPQFIPPGSAIVPASLFPGYFTTTPPSPPIVFANIFNMGAVPPPSTPGQNPPAIIPSPVATIPQLPWNPNPNRGPVNTVPPGITPLTSIHVGQSLAGTTGTWTGASPFTYTRQWLRNGSPIAGATGAGYTLIAADLGADIGMIVTARDTNGLETSAGAPPVGPVLAAIPVVSPATFNLTLPLTANQPVGNVVASNSPTAFAITTGNPAGYYAISNAGALTVTAAGAAGIPAGTASLGVTATNAGGTSPAATITVIVAALLAADEEDDEPTTLPSRAATHRPKPRKKR
jgi:hypothetical protein|nr:hypothetical protein [Bradyrhizobium sp.]